MKFFRELLEDVNCLIVEEKQGNKSYYIEGIMIQGAKPNRNGRIYPMEVLDKEVSRYINESINKNRAVGELGHPEGPNINYDRVSHKFISLRKEGNDYIGKAKILTELPKGQIAKNLLDEGIQMATSTRGIGSLVKKNGIMEVQSDFRLATAGDIVHDPSAPDAFVKGIMEGREWIFDIASNNWVTAELVENVKKAGKLPEEAKMLAIFESFIANITKK